MNDVSDNANIIQYSILLAVFAVGFFGLSGHEKRARAKMFVVWVAIILALVAAYSYWPEVRNSKFFASLVPGTPIIEGNRMEFIKAEDGHFYINAEVKGKSIKFMVDTGASSIVLTQKDAEKLGFDVKALDYNQYFSTANGSVRGASVKLSYLEVGHFQMQNFYVSINEGELDSSLLGMAFLDKFKSYRVEGNKLILEH